MIQHREAKIVVSQRLIQPNEPKSQSLLKDFSPATNYVLLPNIDLLSNTSSSLSGICLSFFFLFGQKLKTHCVCLFVCLFVCSFFSSDSLKRIPTSVSFRSIHHLTPTDLSFANCKPVLSQSVCPSVC
jgi:hypothetical protein